MLLKGTGQIRSDPGYNNLTHGMYLLKNESGDEVTMHKIVKTGTFSNITFINKSKAAKSAETMITNIHLDTLISFSKDGFTTQGVLKSKNTYNIALHPRTKIGDKPDHGNTGPTGPLVLGGSSVLKSGETVSGYYFVRPLIVTKSNVTLKNFIINVDRNLYGVSGEMPGLVMEDGEIFNMFKCAFYGSNFTARRINIHEGQVDGLKAESNVTVEGCWIHHLGSKDKAHADGEQIRRGGNSVFRGNNFDMAYPGTPGFYGAPYKSNSCFIIATEDGPIDNILIENNWLVGGNYTIYSASKTYGDPKNIRVRNNIFGRSNGGFKDGKEAARIRTGVFKEWSGNVWEDNGQPAP